MRIIQPNHPGFSLQGYLGSILRVGVKIMGRVGEGSPLASVLGQRFPLAEAGWISTVTGWIGQGKLAMQQLFNTGSITSAVIDATPIIPAAAFPVEPGERIVVVGDFVGKDVNGDEVDRRLTSIGGIEGQVMEELFGKAIWNLLLKIRSTNPAEYDEFIDRLFEAHWLGRVF